ncbi:MAG: hypothetical protein ACRDTP_11075, partial [Mycobacteriales bacterium]
AETGPEHEVWAKNPDWDEAVPAGGTHDHILFGSAPPPAIDDLPPVMPLLEASVAPDPERADALPMRHRRPTTDTAVPLPGGQGTLTRRVPQQALRAAGGTPPPPETYPVSLGGGTPPAPDADLDAGPAAPDPQASTNVVTSYRVGVARGRTETGHTRKADTDRDTTDTPTQGADA